MLRRRRRLLSYVVVRMSDLAVTASLKLSDLDGDGKDPVASFKQTDLKGESIRRLRSRIRIQVETERIQAERITEAGSIGDHYFNEEYVLHLFD